MKKRMANPHDNQAPRHPDTGGRGGALNSILGSCHHWRMLTALNLSDVLTRPRLKTSGIRDYTPEAVGSAVIPKRTSVAAPEPRRPPPDIQTQVSLLSIRPEFSTPARRWTEALAGERNKATRLLR